MKLIRLLLCLVLITSSLQILAQVNCYETTRKMGIDLFEKGDLPAASKKFEAAKYCPDKPADNDLDSWIAKCAIYVRVSPNPMVFEASEPEEQSSEISTNAKSFKVGKAPKWCTVTQQGKVLTVNCEDNFSIVQREGRIPIQAGGKVGYLEIVQQPADLEFEFDPDLAVFSSQKETKAVVVTTNAPEWVVDSLPSWLVSDKRADTLLLYSEKNTSSQFREGEVILESSGRFFELPVRQLPGDTVINASKQELVFTSDISMEKVRVISNMDGWTTETTDNWIEVTQMNDSVQIVVQENQSLFSRHGNLRLKSGRCYFEVMVHQAPHVSKITMPESELKTYNVSGRDTIMVRSIPSDLLVYVDDQYAQTTPFPCQVDFEHHSIRMGFERREFLFNEKQQDIIFEPGMRFATLTFTAPKNIGFRTGFISANQFGAYSHFQASMPLVNQFAEESEKADGYHFMVGPVYSPIKYAAVYAGIGMGFHEGPVSNGLPNINLDYEAGVMGMFKNAMVSMGFRTTRWGSDNASKRTTFVFGVGGYLKRYYDSEKGYCTSDSRRWTSLSFVSRPAAQSYGLMIGDMGKEKARTYIKMLYGHPVDSVQNFDASLGIIFTPVNGLIDMCIGLGAAATMADKEFSIPTMEVEAGFILNFWRIPLTVMLHESDLFHDTRHMYVDFGIGFHLGEFNRNSYK